MNISNMLKLIILFALIASSASELCDYKDTVNVTSGESLPNGEILHQGIRYAPDEYYTNVTENSIRGCVCPRNKCRMAKCCPIGQAYFMGTGCQEWPEPFSPTVMDFNFNVRNINVTEQFTLMFDKPECDPDPSKEVRVLMSDVNVKKSRLRIDGRLYMEIPSQKPPWLVREPNKYCVDTFIFEDDNGTKTSSSDAILCFVPDEDPSNYPLSSTCMIISCVFILVTVSVYACLPELRNLHGRVLMAYLLSIFVAFVFLATMQIMLMLNSIVQECCVAMTFIIYFSLLASFFWLNVMCFDIWWTFSGKRGMMREKMSIRTKFCAYCVYAFGLPSILTFILLTLEFAGLPPHPLLPMIKQGGCFISGKTKLIYLYGPIVILCVVNMVFFIMTALKIAEIKQQTAVLKSKESATHDRTNSERQRLCLYVKLFAVMGVSWILEVISYMFPEANKIWCFTDAYNLLIGLLVFVIFVCKRKIFRLMKKRIKDRILHRKNEIGNMTMMHRHDIPQSLKDYKQRDSLDTIGTTCPDSDSNKDTNKFVAIQFQRVNLLRELSQQKMK